jgi:hypothetical protein
MIMKGESMVLRRLVTLLVSSCLVLGIGAARVEQLFAQADAQKDAPASKVEAASKDAAKTDSAKTQETKKDETKKAAEPAKAAEPPLPPIPPAVQEKLNAAWRAIAEAIVAAQDAGLVETSIDPPPILDILINGRATDARTLKDPTKKPFAVSPEVFGAWFTSFGKLDGVDYTTDVRIVNPSAGLKQWYDQRARLLEQSMQEVRKAKGQKTPEKAETKPAAPAAPAVKKAEEPKK